MITPEQIRGARAMLGLTQAELAKLAGLSTTGLNNIESGGSDPKASTLRAIQAALEAAGVIFIEENGDGPGVRLRKGRDAQSRMWQQAREMALNNLAAMTEEENAQITAAALADPDCPPIDDLTHRKVKKGWRPS